MRNSMDRHRDRASFITPPYEQPGIILAHAIRELCYTIDEAAEVIASALKGRDQRPAQYYPPPGDAQVLHKISTVDKG